MIVAGEAREYVPFGREFSLHHPGRFQIKVENAPVLNTVDLGFPLSQEFKNISLLPTPLLKDRWVVKQCVSPAGVSCDEELYISENTVIWSRGIAGGVHTVIKTCTMETPVIQALWCKFVLPSCGEPKTVCEESNVASGEEQPGICVVEASCVTVFTDQGDHYSTALPFQVSKVWPVKYGLLFERVITDSHLGSAKRTSPNQTTIFSMQHPLDEVAPVINKSAGKVNYMTDMTQVLIFTSETPSIALMYDTMLGVHSVWSIRSPKQDEVYSTTGFWDGASFCHPMTPGGPGLNQSSSNQSKFTSTLSSQSSSFSPLRSMSARVGSPAFTSHSSPAAPHICHTPLSSLDHLHSPLSRLYTPSPPSRASPGNFYRTPGGKSQLSIIGNDSYSDWVKPLSPEVCLDQLWTETTPAIRDGSLGKASKAFLMKDMCGQQYMCYLVTFRNQLRCVKYVESNDMSQLIFGASNVIQARDAQPVPSEDLLIVLDLYGYIMLYTGVTKLNKIHIASLPLSSGANVSLLRSVTPVSPTPGRIITSSRPSSANDARFDDEVQLISPVPTEMDDSQLDGSATDEFPLSHTGYIVAIRDCIDNRFTLELMNGSLCQSTIPALCQSVAIRMCLKALKYILPRDTAITFLTQWYQGRNSPGGVGSHTEWALFYDCLLTQMGYSTASLHLTSQEIYSPKFVMCLFMIHDKCECGARQTIDHLINFCPTLKSPNGTQGLIELDDATVRWLHNVDLPV